MGLCLLRQQPFSDPVDLQSSAAERFGHQLIWPPKLFGSKCLHFFTWVQMSFSPNVTCKCETSQ